jgi:hypothetical protein
MATAAAIDRLVHHATIIEIDHDCMRAEKAGAGSTKPGAERTSSGQRLPPSIRPTTTYATTTTSINDGPDGVAADERGYQYYREQR